MSDTDVIRQVHLQILNEGRVDLIDEIFAPDFVSHFTPPGFPPGREGFRAFVSVLRATFPDLKSTIVHEVHEGDTHTFHIRVTGSMTGEFMGVPATGKRAVWDEMHLATMRDGKITEHWGVIDRLDMFQKLGVIPPLAGHLAPA